jgi:hypothetical protein
VPAPSPPVAAPKREEPRRETEVKREEVKRDEVKEERKEVHACTCTYVQTYTFFYVSTYSQS